MGMAAAQLGSEQIMPVIGPQSLTLEGIKLFMRSVMSSRPWKSDPSLLPFEWREGAWLNGDRDTEEAPSTKETKLRVAVLWTDGVVEPLPPVRRALQTVVSRLKEVPGIEVEDWIPPIPHSEGMELLVSLVSDPIGETWV